MHASPCMHLIFHPAERYIVQWLGTANLMPTAELSPLLGVQNGYSSVKTKA